MGLSTATSELLDPQLFPYAVGQGALGIEARGEDADILAILKEIEDPKARAEVDCERAMLHTLGAGCSLPVGAFTSWKDGRLILQAQITSLDGQQRIVAIEDEPAERAVELGIATAESLRKLGGVDILETAYRNFCSHYKFLRS